MSTMVLSRLKNILVIMMGGIGNMIFLTPALKALRRALPSSSFCFLLGTYGAEKAIEGSGLIDKKIVIEPDKYKGLSGYARLIRELRKERFTLSITSTGMNPVKSGLLCFLSGIKFRSGENIGGKGFFYNLKIPFYKDLHEVESNIQLIQSLGIEVKDRSLFVQRSEEDKKFARDFFSQHGLEGKPVIGLHAGSGIHQAGFKRWPRERFSQLADRLSDELEAAVILFGGADEVELADEITKTMRSEPIVMSGKTSLAQTAALIEKCRLFISNDSGLLHVSGAVNTPGIGIFGPTNPKRTGPYSDSSSVIRKELACIPCYQGKPVRCSHLECLNLITVAEVFEEARKRLEKDVC